MNYRFMRLLVMFDLPVETAKNKRDYSKFRKYLLKSGFVMFQESIYSKLVINNVSSKSVRENLKKNLPSSGFVSVLEITENQYNSMEILLGEGKSNVIQNTERLIEIDD